MPINENLTPVTLPMDLKFNQAPTTRFVNNLEALNIELVDAPTVQQARDVAWHYVKATWADTPSEISPSEAKDSANSEPYQPRWNV
jgi:hypothetical protein